jgi:hypothetical protein
MLGKEAVGRAAQLRPGNQVVLQGTVKGLMMNVLVDDCIFIEQ